MEPLYCKLYSCAISVVWRTSLLLAVAGLGEMGSSGKATIVFTVISSFSTKYTQAHCPADSITSKAIFVRISTLARPRRSGLSREYWGSFSIYIS